MNTIRIDDLKTKGGKIKNKRIKKARKPTLKVLSVINTEDDVKRVRLTGLSKVFTQTGNKAPTGIFIFEGLGEKGGPAKMELIAPDRIWLNWFNKNKEKLNDWFKFTLGREPRSKNELMQQILFETQRLGKKRLAEEGTVYAIHPTKKEARRILQTGATELKQTRFFIGESNYKLRILTKLIKSRIWSSTRSEWIDKWVSNGFKGFHYKSNTSTEWYIEDMIGFKKTGQGYKEYKLEFDFSNLTIDVTITRW